MMCHPVLVSCVSGIVKEGEGVKKSIFLRPSLMEAPFPAGSETERESYLSK